MASQDEDLAANPFLQALQQNFASIYAQAAPQRYIICVPRQASLTLAKYTEDFVKTHILRLSPYFREEYVTLNEKTVTFKGVTRS